MTEDDIDNDKSDDNAADNDIFLCQPITTDTSVGTIGSSAASYIYQRSIQVTPHAIQVEQNIGSTQSLIIAFNLALAYHLTI